MASPAQFRIHGGLIVTSQNITRADILVGDGVIQAIGPDLSPTTAARTIDAHRKLVLPGVIDAHVHPGPDEPMATVSRAAAHGGVTTLIPFVSAFRASGATAPLLDEVRKFIEEGQRTSYLDFALHASFAKDDDFAGTIPALFQMGVISAKIYLAYGRRGMMLTDELMLQVMELTAAQGGIAMVHAENGPAIDYLVDRFIAQGKTSPEYFPLSQPPELELEAITRAVTLANLVDCPLYIVHVSYRGSLEVLERFRGEGKRVYTETCPQYLLLTDDQMTKRGSLAKMGPPLRKPGDNAALWQAVSNGIIDTIASDTVAAITKNKSLGGTITPSGQPDNIFDARFGAPGAEWLLTTVYDEGINRGKITLCKLVQVLCENPAKIFGLYPKKGTLQVGADADLVIFDPTILHTISAARGHGQVDYTLFEGRECLGDPVFSMQRGHVLLEDGQLKSQAGQAKFLPGKLAISG